MVVDANCTEMPMTSKVRNASRLVVRGFLRCLFSHALVAELWLKVSGSTPSGNELDNRLLLKVSLKVSGSTSSCNELDNGEFLALPSCLMLGNKSNASLHI